MGNLACIGAQPRTPEELEPLFARASLAGSGEGFQLHVWRDSSGARLEFVLDPRRDLLCLTPSFDGPARVRAKLTGFIADAECKFCDRVQVEIMGPTGEVCYPLVLQLHRLALLRSRLELGAALELSITGFAGESRSWATVAEYEAQPSEGRRFAAQSLIPLGVFTKPGESATPAALITGTVRATESRVNLGTGQPFVSAVVETFGGLYNVVAAAGEASQVVGGVLQATCWMMGEVTGGLATGPEQKKPGLWKRLLGKR
jgi:hypothetical protein